MIKRGDIKIGDIIKIDDFTIQRCNYAMTYEHYCSKDSDIFAYTEGLKFKSGTNGIVKKVVNTCGGNYAFINMNNGCCCIAETESVIRINKFRKGEKVTKIDSYSFTVGKGDIVTVDEYSIGINKILFTIDEVGGYYDQNSFIDCKGLNIGDTVEIINNGKQYTTYEQFYVSNKTEDSFPYEYQKSNLNGEIGTITAISQHGSYKHSTLALVNMTSGNSAIINIEGLSKIKNNIGEGDDSMNKHENLKRGQRIMRLTESVTHYNNMPKNSIATISRLFVDRIYTNEYIGSLSMDEFVVVEDKAYDELKDKIKEQADKKENLRKMNRKTIREQADKIASLQAQVNKYKPKKKDIDEDTLNNILCSVNKDRTMGAYILDNVITCELTDIFGNVIATGKARKHPNDDFDLDTGLTLACIRAIKNEYINKEKEISKNLELTNKL